MESYSYSASNVAKRRKMSSFKAWHYYFCKIRESAIDMDFT